MARRTHRRMITAALVVTVLVTVAGLSCAGAATAAGPTIDRAAAITVSAPRQVAQGDRVAFTGDVVTRRGTARRVQVAERSAGRWVVVGSARSTPSGGFRLSVRAGRTAGTRIFRAQAPRAGALPAVRTGRLSVEVLGGASGNADDWTFLMDGGARWNPCEPITWSYNPVGQGYDALGDVTAAFAKIADASGLTFEYAGSTPLVYLGLPNALVGGADITVGWSSATVLSDLVGSVVGVGGALGTQVTGRDVRYELTRGWVTLDKADPLRPKPGFGASSFGQVVLHETLHVLGLGHAKQPTQLMYPVASAQNTTFGPGDLAGIARIGAAAGCL